MRTDIPFRGSVAIASGTVTRGRLRGPGFRRVGPDTYVDAGAPDDLRTAIRAVLVRYPDAVLVGPTAAVVWGAVDPADHAGLSGREPVEISRDGYEGSAPGVRIRGDRLGSDEISGLDGWRLSSPGRTAFDLARRLPTADAVVALEGLRRARQVTIGEVRRIAEAHPASRDVVRMRAALALVDDRSRTALQTRLRIAILAARVTPPAVAYRQQVTGELTAGELDLAWPDERCGFVCGRDDATAWAMAGPLVEDGWVVRRISPASFASDPQAVVEGTELMLRRQRRALGTARRERARNALTWTRPRRRRDPGPTIFERPAS